MTPFVEPIPNPELQKKMKSRRNAIALLGYKRGMADTNGLALSGGGIRSAAFSIGVMQALQEFGQQGKQTTAPGAVILPNVDYISSVSGGGYAAAGLIYHGSKDKPPFPVDTSQQQDGFPYGPADREGGLMPRLRDRSSYLLTGGRVRQGFMALAMYLRVLAISILALAPVVLGFALVMAGLYASRGTLVTLAGYWPYVAAAVFLGLIGTAAFNRSGGQHEDSTPRLLSLVLMGFAAIAGLAVSLLVMHGLTLIADPGDEKTDPASLTPLIPAAFSLLLLARERLMRKAKRDPGAQPGAISAGLAKTTLALAGLALPLALWLLALRLGLAIVEFCVPVQPWANSQYWAAVLFGPVLLGLGSVALFDIDRNSMSEFYRRGLAHAFLQRDFEWFLHEANLSRLPYPILNASVSTLGTAQNARGRNAETFVMTPLHYGNKSLGYCSMEDAAHAGLDLSKAMAVSGAAAAPNMGMGPQGPGLAFSMAFLGIRLGRWLPDPKHMPATGHAPIPTLLHLWQEALRLSGRSHKGLVLLSDGGHSENLGVIELLRRRCRLIVAVDAEQDGDLRCPSLTRLMRIARIDEGITIRIDLRPLAASHKEAMRVVKEGLPDEGRVPRYHGALGLVHYPDGEIGYLLYIKASMTGDEFAPIQAYARSHPAFPHESTGDQFFDEEQFESYRALGVHAARDVLQGKALWIHDALKTGDGKKILSYDAVLQRLRP